ncbi:MAG TPA: ABC transporter ATP-binding protein [Opitutaceae bacterium]
MSRPIIEVSGLSKVYRLGEIGAFSLREELAATWARFRHRAPKTPPKDFWALRDVSFSVQPGEVIGVIGRNGAGKSTLLKVLSRITEPTSGRAVLRGRVASLLEVGTGFHPDLSGRDNIYLNGAILGMKRAEIRRKFDEIVAFAEVGQFIDTPVKRYSSGMYVRLAFAVAAHLEPEILIVDEVLAVGDAEFQKKCLGKMRDVSTRSGRTVLFVSHNMVAVQSLCDRTVLMSGGAVAQDGPVEEGIARYLQSFHHASGPQAWASPGEAPGNDTVRIKRVNTAPTDASADGLTMRTPFAVDFEYWVKDASRPFHLAVHLVNEQNVVVLTTGTKSRRQPVGLHRARCHFPGGLLNSGSYTIKLLIVENENRLGFVDEGIASFTIADRSQRDGAWHGREPGVVQPTLTWETDD